MQDIDLLDALEVEPTSEEGSYLGHRPDNAVELWRIGRVYGGYILAQALAASFHTVSEDKLAHSLHAYFHKTGDVELPITYQVTVLRDGRTYATRQVLAMQNEKLICSMTVSFKTRDQDEVFEHSMPEVLSPQAAIDMRAGRRFPRMNPPMSFGGQVQIEPCTNGIFREDLLEEGEVRDLNFGAWKKLLDDQPLTERQQQIMTVFMSDGPISVCGALKHSGYPNLTHQTMSLDHSIWFHSPAEARNWTLLSATSRATRDGRSLNDASLYRESGELVASIRQESLLRKIERTDAELEAMIKTSKAEWEKLRPPETN